MKILITGSNGMLGSLLTQELEKNRNYEVFPTGRDQLDITNNLQVENYISETKPRVIINCAAYTNVNEAEDTQKEINYNVNAIGPKILAENCKKNNIRFIHISTNYVFGSNKDTGYLEEDEPEIGEQLNEYGRAKREGEIFTMELNSEALICRVPWIYGPNGKNFVDTMLNLAKDKNELSIVTDEIGTPTYTLDVVNQLKYILQNLSNIEGGYYHITNEGRCSRYDEAAKIFEIAGIKIKLNRTTLSAFPRKAKVPTTSILKNTKLPKLRDWEDALEEYIKTKESN
jgi:dTDP-4-dehydrorhamnose reductase